MSRKISFGAIYLSATLGDMRRFAPSAFVGLRLSITVDFTFRYESSR